MSDTDIDILLNRLRGLEADPRLAGMDAAVLAGVAVSRERAASRRGVVLTSVLALCVGLLAGMLPAPNVPADQIMAFNDVPSVAPSSLLMGVR